MVIMHNKTGDLYYLGSEKCKAKINGEWKDAVLYRGWEKNTGEYYHFVREKSDFDIRFTAVRMIEPDLDDLCMAYRISVLKEIAAEYPGKTIGNIIAQMEARKKELINN